MAFPPTGFSLPSERQPGGSRGAGGEEDDTGRSRTPRVAVIGGGFGGIAVGVKLKRAGITSFTIFEKSDGIGGTWWENRYPGAECDTESNIYSYSFRPHRWSRTHARQPEIQSYLESVVDAYGLRPHFRINTAIVEARWSEADHTYTVTAANGFTDTYHVVVSAVGLLSAPRLPDWPGLDRFRGVQFHTATWPPALRLKGKRVAVVGTGSSAAQIVGSIAGSVGQLVVLQREPATVLPKNSRDYTSREQALFRIPLVRRVDRARRFAKYEMQPMARRTGTRLNRAAARKARDYRERVFAGRPDLLAALTPMYPMYGKRVVVDDNFYPALLRDNVMLVASPVVRVTETGVVDATETEHPVDVLIMATGFQPTRFLAGLNVFGRDGRSIHKVWGPDPNAFLGITVPGFPNFYMLYGPNTNAMVLIFNLERQADFVLRNVRRMTRTGVTAIDTRREWFERYDRWLCGKLAQVTAWTLTNNYYKSESGRVVTQWPAGALHYLIMTRLFRGPSSSVSTAESRVTGNRTTWSPPEGGRLDTAGSRGPDSRR